MSRPRKNRATRKQYVQFPFFLVHVANALEQAPAAAAPAAKAAGNGAAQESDDDESDSDESDDDDVRKFCPRRKDLTAARLLKLSLRSCASSRKTVKHCPKLFKKSCILMLSCGLSLFVFPAG